MSDSTRTYLDFERPIAELDSKIEELEAVLARNGEDAPDVAEEIAKLRQKSSDQLKALYGKLDAWRKTMVARHPERPHLKDYISGLVTDFEELAGDRRFGEDHVLRLICITRAPVDRAVSEYNHTLRHNWETLSFGEALYAEPERIATGWHPLFYHRRRSTIRDDLHRYHDLLGERLMIVDHAELAAPELLLRRIAEFLGVPHDAAERIERENRTILPRNALAEAALKNRTLRRVGRMVAPEALRQRIRQALQADARELRTVAPCEIDRLRHDLAAEIERCLASPLIPTASWRTALQG